MKKPLLFVTVSVLALGSTVAITRQGFSQAAPPYQAPDARSAWVAECLTQINTIRPGSKKQDFDRLFEIAGSLSDGKTYSYRRCPYFKVSAEFQAGKVTRISRPYLDQVYTD